MGSGLVLDIHADYEIAPHMVVFSHGFGVDRTSRGMFSEIVAALPEDYGYVMFDYYDITDKTVNISTLEDQQRILLTIIGWLSEQSEVIDISLVAHSVGCLVAAVAQPPEIKHAVMLAPPLRRNESMRDYFLQKPGVAQRGELWYVPRRDGTTSIIPNALFDELGALNAEQVLLDYAAVQPFQLIIPTQDEVLGSVDYNELALDEHISAITIDAADHNFSGPRRADMIKAVMSWFGE